jgi:hypothetical protein
MRTMSRRAAYGLSLIILIGCGEGLSSLDAVQRSARQVYEMTLSPDFGRRGNAVTISVDFDPELKLLLENSGVAYPTKIFFGEQINIEYFGTVDMNLQIKVRISPLAREGERIPTLVFSLGDRLVEARGSFWVLPAQPDFAKATSGHLAIPPRGKPRGILAKASDKNYCQCLFPSVAPPTDRKLSFISANCHEQPTSDNHI